MFSEVPAEYSALTMEKRFRREAAQKFLRGKLDGYLRGRGTRLKLRATRSATRQEMPIADYSRLGDRVPGQKVGDPFLVKKAPIVI
jgi:hypothetical protein